MIQLSVCMITYNHEQFIAQAIESVLMQKTNFEFEIIICEDCSTDKTREICVSLKDKYPDKITLVLNKVNIGMLPNFIQALTARSGKYIALLEGDDFWTDPNKLQKQFDFLEANPEYSICFHNAFKLYEESNTKKIFINKTKIKDTYSIDDILKQNFIPTLSCVYRNHLIKDFPKWFYDAMPGDWFLHILNAQFGKLKYINEIMGTYRIHAGGNYSGPPQIRNFEKTIKSLESLYQEIDDKYKKKVLKVLSKRYFSLGKLLLKNNAKKEALNKTIHSIKLYPLNILIVPFHYLKFFTFAFLPLKIVVSAKNIKSN